MTIFFFTLTTYVAHGDVNIKCEVNVNVVQYNVILVSHMNKKEQVDILNANLLAYQ